jgi:polyisoprenoid-binding protein YceI
MMNQPAIAGAIARVSSVGLMLVAGAALSAAAPARLALANPVLHPSVKFTVSVSNGTKIVGSGTEIRLESAGAWLTFRVPLTAISTRWVPRDRQLRDRYLEADTHPMVELKIAREALKIPRGGGVTEGSAPATLKLHGKAREVTVRYALERKGETVDVKGSFEIDLRAHGVDVPNYRGITVSPRVAVEVSFGSIDRELVADATAM